MWHNNYWNNDLSTVFPLAESHNIIEHPHKGQMLIQAWSHQKRLRQLPPDQSELLSAARPMRRGKLPQPRDFSFLIRLSTTNLRKHRWHWRQEDAHWGNGINSIALLHIVLTCSWRWYWWQDATTTALKDKINKVKLALTNHAHSGDNEYKNKTTDTTIKKGTKDD